MSDVIPFPVGGRNKTRADQVRVAFDFGQWKVDFFRWGKLLRREPMPNELTARNVAARYILEHGLTMLPGSMPFQTLHDPDDDGDAA